MSKGVAAGRQTLLCWRIAGLLKSGQCAIGGTCPTGFSSLGQRARRLLPRMCVCGLLMGPMDDTFTCDADCTPILSIPSVMQPAWRRMCVGQAGGAELLCTVWLSCLWQALRLLSAIYRRCSILACELRGSTPWGCVSRRLQGLSCRTMINRQHNV